MSSHSFRLSQSWNTSFFNLGNPIEEDDVIPKNSHPTNSTFEKRAIRSSSRHGSFPRCGKDKQESHQTSVISLNRRNKGEAIHSGNLERLISRDWRFGCGSRASITSNLLLMLASSPFSILSSNTIFSVRRCNFFLNSACRACSRISSSSSTNLILKRRYPTS